MTREPLTRVVPVREETDIAKQVFKRLTESPLQRQLREAAEKWLSERTDQELASLCTRNLGDFP